MRMWMINPKYLCKSHLLGEHGEIHKHKHNFVKGHKIDGRLSPFVAIEPANMESRHDILAKEMLSRGFNHKSPFEQPDLYLYTNDQINVKVNKKLSIQVLMDRCDKCKKRIQTYNRRERILTKLKK